jgi:uncharacterized protein (TIGR03435 family)
VRTLFAVLLLGLGVSAQSNPPAFDVVSVKRVVDTPISFPGVMLQPGGRVTSPGTSVRQLILLAYGLQDLQLSGGPSWIGAERYTIEARTGADATRASVRSMVKTLLAERFQLVAHLEKRELPAFALILANRDGKLGPRLVRSGSTCAPVTPPPGVPIPPPPPPGGPAFTPVLPQDPLGDTCGFVNFPGWVSGRTITMAHVAQILIQLTRRPVVDETGLTGDFDVDVTELAQSDRPPLLTAIQDDLGLKLETRRRDVDVLVIDRVERPSEN